MKSKELYWSAKFPTSGFQTSKNAPAMKHTDLLFVNSLSLSLSVCRQQNITFFGRRANRYPFSSRDSEICSRHSGAPTSVAPPQKVWAIMKVENWTYLAEYGSELESDHNAYLLCSLIEESYMDGGRAALSRKTPTDPIRSTSINAFFLMLSYPSKVRRSLLPNLATTSTLELCTIDPVDVNLLLIDGFFLFSS
jgi:hypothetical protein